MYISLNQSTIIQDTYLKLNKLQAHLKQTVKTPAVKQYFPRDMMHFTLMDCLTYLPYLF